MHLASLVDQEVQDNEDHQVLLVVEVHPVFLALLVPLVDPVPLDHWDHQAPLDSLVVKAHREQLAFLDLRDQTAFQALQVSKATRAYQDLWDRQDAMGSPDQQVKLEHLGSLEFKGLPDLRA